MHKEYSLCYRPKKNKRSQSQNSNKITRRNTKKRNVCQETYCDSLIQMLDGRHLGTDIIIYSNQSKTLDLKNERKTTKFVTTFK